MVISLEDRINHYQAWLNMAQVKRPLFGLLWEVAIRPLPEFTEFVGQGHEIEPDQVQPELFFPFIESWFRRDALLSSDIIQSFSPAFGILWAEAILGCSLVTGQGSIWSKPFLESYEDWIPVYLSSDNPWLDKLLEFTKALVDLSDGRFPVSLPPIHSPLDMLGSIRGGERMLLDLFEQPSAVKRTLSDLTQLYMSIVERCLDIIPPFCGGYTTRMRMWAPGRAIVPQNEYAPMISTKMYETFALEIDRSITEHFPYHSFHLHGTGQHQIDALLSLEGLTAIQLTLEHHMGGPSLEAMLPLARNILQKKPLLLAVPDLDTAEICIQELPWQGLLILIMEDSYTLDEKYDEWLEAHCTPPYL